MTRVGVEPTICRLLGTARENNNLRPAGVDLRRASVPRSVAVKVTSHLTESVNNRHAIVAAADLREQVGKLAALADNGARTILPFFVERPVVR